MFTSDTPLVALSCEGSGVENVPVSELATEATGQEAQRSADCQCWALPPLFYARLLWKKQWEYNSVGG